MLHIAARRSARDTVDLDYRKKGDARGATLSFSLSLSPLSSPKFIQLLDGDITHNPAEPALRNLTKCIRSSLCRAFTRCSSACMDIRAGQLKAHSLTLGLTTKRSRDRVARSHRNLFVECNRRTEIATRFKVEDRFVLAEI